MNETKKNPSIGCDAENCLYNEQGHSCTAACC